MDNTSNRKHWIDFSRAIGIFAIVYGHLVLGESVFSQFFGSFRVAIFFCVMGLTFNFQSNFLMFLKKKTLRLLVPYIIFAFVSIIVMWLIGLVYPSLLDGKQSGFLQNIWGAIYANGLTGNMNWNLPLWFLPCAFVSLILVYLFEGLIHSLSRKFSIVLRLVFIILSIVLNYIYCVLFKWLKLPFGAEVAISMSGFIEIGIILRDLDKLIRKLWFGFAGLLLMIISFLLSIKNGDVSVMSLNFGNNYFLYYFVSITAIVGVFILAICFCSFELFKGMRTVICYCGMHTLAILCMHKFPIVFFQYIFPITKKIFRLSEENALKNLLGFLISTIVIVICLIVELPIIRFVPQVFGSVRRDKRIINKTNT